MPKSEAELVADLVARTQTHILPRRIRCKEFFVDADPLRSGRCSESYFHRGLVNLGLKKLTEEEVAATINYFTDYGPKVMQPQVVNYSAFCAEVDKIFADEEQQEDMRMMTMSCSPGSTVSGTFVPQDVADEEGFMHVLHRVAALCKAKGVSIKALYVDFDRTTLPNPSMLNTRRGGKVTKEQFMRVWPFKKEMKPEDLEVICEKFNAGEGDVHFIALHNEITAVEKDPAQPFPTSPLYLRPDDTEWSHSSVPVVTRITAKVVEKRMRLKEHFQDFDPLRKGLCSPGQVKTVFTIMNLSREIDRNDYEALLATYMQADGQFNYQAMCSDVERAFTTPGLEQFPLAVLEMPDADTTSPGRRNTMRLSKEKLGKISRVEDKIRTFVRQRRVEMKPMFQDFDIAHRGYVTRSQFHRIMATMSLDLDDKAIGYLCGTYCDFGNHTDFNYKRFLKCVDPPRPDVEVAMLEMTSPHIPFKPHPYFDKKGKVLSKSYSTSMLP